MPTELETREMWSSHVAQLVPLINSSTTRRRAFIAGFNGQSSKGIHRHIMDSWELGRYTAKILTNKEHDQDV